MLRRRVLVVVCLAVLSADARADDAVTARKAFNRATKLFNANKYVEAIEAFKLAYRMRPHFRVQCSIARCHQIIGEVVQAVEHFQRCLKEGAAKSPMKTDIEKMLKDAKAAIAWVNVRSPGGEGRIFVDDVQRGRAPARVPLNPGTHVIRVEREGTVPTSAKIKFLGGEERDLTLIPVAPGELEQKKDDRKKDDSKRDGKPATRLSPVWFWTAVGATAALAIGMIVAGVLTRQARNDYNSDPTKERADSFDSRRLTTNVLVGLTAAAATGSTVLFFFTDFGRSETPDPGRGATAFGVGVRGSF